MLKSMTAAAAGLAVTFALGAPANAAEIAALVSNALKSTLQELAPQFEKATEHKLKITFGSTDPLKARIEKGEVLDFALFGDGAIDELVKQGKLVAATRAAIARAGLGVAIRQGTPRPDLSSIDAFKKVVLAARSVSYNERGLTGNYLNALFERLGIAAAVKAKFKNGSGAELVGKGEAEIGFTQASEVALVAGVELGGTLPPEIQNYTAFAAAVTASAKNPDAAQALLKFLTGPDAVRVMKAKGLEPAS